MSSELLDHSPDLQRLVNEGYELEIISGYLLTHHIPYLTSAGEVKLGVLASELSLASPTQTTRPAHTMHFMGDNPCHRDGKVMTEIINSSPNQNLVSGIVGNHLFSSKPPCGYYNDYYEKVTHYCTLLLAPARAVDSTATAQTYKPIVSDDEKSVFQYQDTNASRANVAHLNEKFRGQRIAIIGLGGTGSYLLDQVAKTPVQEIHLFDGDVLLQHNAFRAPGAVPLTILQQKPQIKKVQYYAGVYSHIHKHIVPHAEYLTEDNIGSLRGMSYVFICIDKGKEKKKLIQMLISMGIPLLDVGMGLEVVDDRVIGILRVTIGTPGKYDHLPQRISFGEDDQNDYANIQIADLNAFNAILAVIKWKKLSGFYDDQKKEYHSTYTINTSQLLHGDITT
jgi:hypothetical protein